MALSEDGRRLSGMGVVFQDYDNDGRPDIIVTEFAPRNLRRVSQRGQGTVQLSQPRDRAWACCRAEARAGVSAWKISTTMGGRICSWRRVTCWTMCEQIDPSLHYWEPPCWR